VSTKLRAWLEEFVTRPDFLRKYRYYAAVLARLEAVEDASVRVMAVSAHRRRFYLHVNPDFFLNPPTNIRFIRGVLLHEVHHIVLGHLTHEKFRGAAHPDLMELAMEVSANEYITEPLPGSPPVWSAYARLGLRAGQSTRERYELLVQAREAGAVIEPVVCIDEHLPSGVGGVRPGAPPAPAGAAALARRLVADAIAGASPVPAGQGGLLAGRDPGQVLELLPDAGEAPAGLQVWRTALAMFVAQVRAPRTTYTRPNRRFPSWLGIIPGRRYHPSPSRPLKMLVAIDTSGSMSTEELTEIARQLRRLDRLVRFTVVECDAAIQRIYRFEGRLADVAGRGGTDLRPVFAPELLQEHRPEGVIYFTDGLGPYPPEDPGIRTLWVLTKELDFDCPWGKKACLRAGEVA
jgi:predicted metal-dependent peptidase